MTTISKTKKRAAPATAEKLGVHATHETPMGPFTVVTDWDDGAVLASGWAADPLRLLGHVPPALQPTELAEAESTGAASDALFAYLEGDVAAIDSVAVRQQGSPFFARAWRELRTIPAGDPVGYAELAAMAGNPRAVRAAGTACGTNSAALFVPCHRVVRSDGSLGGFGWGLPVKDWLLEHERTHA